MNHYKDQILACDFFTVKTLFLKTIYVLFFIGLGIGQKVAFGRKAVKRPVRIRICDFLKSVSQLTIMVTRGRYESAVGPKECRLACMRRHS